ncbi:hypothetical protein HRbin19_00358 [bacterium HR19]|nr:hypothetical protein HRbin19_00358 [bacterium HR19]
MSIFFSKNSRPSIFFIFTIFFPFYVNSKLFEIKPVAFYQDIVVSNLDAYAECIIYQMIKKESRCDRDDTDKILLYAILLVFRKSFEDIIGLEQDIAKDILEGENLWKQKVSEDKISLLIALGFTQREIKDRIIRVSVFYEKIEKEFLIDFESLKYVLKKLYLEQNNRLGENVVADDQKTKMIYEIIKTFITDKIILRR